MQTQWRIEFLNVTVEKEFDALPMDIQAEMVRISDLIQEFGLPLMTRPHVAHVQGKIWELRATGKDGWGRCLYATQTGRVVVLLRCFCKKTNKTPKKEIDVALKRMKQLA